MTTAEQRALNQDAARRLKPQIDADYPPKQFVAVAGGRIVADDADLFVLVDKLKALGLDPLDALVERAGDEELPDYIEFL